MSARANNSHNPIAEHTGDTFAPSRIGRTLGRDRDESCRWLAQAWELQPNLLVTDFSFGGHPAGADLIHAVKNDLRTSHIPVLVLSDISLWSICRQTLSGADSVLVKSVMPSVLYSRGKALIRACMDLRSRSVAALKRAEALSRQNVIVPQRGREVVEQLRQRVFRKSLIPNVRRS